MGCDEMSNISFTVHDIQFFFSNTIVLCHKFVTHEKLIWMKFISSYVVYFFLVRLSDGKNKKSKKKVFYRFLVSIKKFVSRTLSAKMKKSGCKSYISFYIVQYKKIPFTNLLQIKL